MNDFIVPATEELKNFLHRVLPELSDNWWKAHVVSQLSFQQQRMVQERGLDSLEKLDLAALLRVFDKNWHELAYKLSLPHDGRSWLKELQGVRNRWAHPSLESPPPSDIYRDLDTLERVLAMIGANIQVLERIKHEKLKHLQHVPLLQEDALGDQGEVLEGKTMFSVGQLAALRSDPSTLVPILEVNTAGAEPRYVVFQDNRKASYYESQLISPSDNESARPRLSVEDFHAHMTAMMLASPNSGKLTSLRMGRINFVPYQYRPVLRLIRADRPRLLIADEVGVGKTIEAGLILQELKARMDLEKVLVLCPKSLVAERKWQVEMKRFDEHFTQLDGPMLRECLRETELDGEWPMQYAKAIVPFSLIDSNLLFGSERRHRRRQEGLLSMDPPPKFDLVIIDEAHYIRNKETYLHEAVRFFCDNAEAVIFLTATPIQLGSQDLFTLLNVLRPDLIIDSASFEQMAEPNPHINRAAHLCREAPPGWQVQALECLDQVASTRWGALFIRESPKFQDIYDQLSESDSDDTQRVRLIREIEDLYTFGSIINRTRRRDIGEFTLRKPETLTIPFTPPQGRLHDRLLDIMAELLQHAHGQQNVKFMMTTIRRQAASCIYGLAELFRGMLEGKVDGLEWQEASDSNEEFNAHFIQQIRTRIEELLTEAENLDTHDPKLEAFLHVLHTKSRMPNNKALVFSTFRHTLAYLSRHMESHGFRFGLVHGGIPDEERAALRRRFSLPKDQPDALDVLLSSEVGCEGLDFQYCDTLVNYDLPWNPMRVEQRIGRIDRYGQKSESIAIINFVTPGTVDAEIYDRCLWRIGVFQHAIGGCEEILGEITQEIHDIAESFTLSADEQARRLQQLSDNGIRRLQEVESLESRQAELFGINLRNQRWEEEIASSDSFWLSPDSLARCVRMYLSKRLGADGEYLLGEKAIKTLRLNQDARAMLLEDYRLLPKSMEPVAREWERWLKGNQPMLSITFEQATAAEDAACVHLNPLHPFVRQSVSYLQLDEPAEVTFTCFSDEINPGNYPFALYRWQKTGVRMEEEFVPISTHPRIEMRLFEFLGGAATTASADSGRVTIDNQGLDKAHHAKWFTARATHMAQVKELSDHQIQSLEVSHQARRSILQDQVACATNQKIQLMKESELARAEADFATRVSTLRSAVQTADIHSGIVVTGMLSMVPCTPHTEKLNG